jgi:hypothetical protein
MTDTAAGGPDNLFTPVDEDYGVRGPFTARSRHDTASTHTLTWLGGGGVRAAGLASLLLLVVVLWAIYAR